VGGNFSSSASRFSHDPRWHAAHRPTLAHRRRPLGDNKDPALKDAGTRSAGGPITTATGLTIIGATIDDKIRAFETRTGKLLWEANLPASNYGTPMTYKDASGRQIVAVVATGGFSGSPPTSDAVVAFSLR